MPRLSPLPPLFGFRGSDVAKFVPAKRKELDDLALQHHVQVFDGVAGREQVK